MIPVIPKGYFGSLAHVASNDPSKRDLDDLIAEIQEAINTGGGGGGGIWGVEATYCDGGRTDVYIPDGTPNKPYKTIQSAADACLDGGVLKIAKHAYSENVVIAGGKHIDADLGTFLTAPSGCPLTFAIGGATGISFVRGISVIGDDPLDWTIKAEGTMMGSIIVFMDGVYGNQANGYGFWAKGSGMYFTDAGGVMGSPKIAARVGEAGSTIGGGMQFGQFNLNTTYDDGKMFQVYRNGRIDCNGTSLSTEGGMSPSSAILAEMVGGSGVGGASLSLKNCKNDSEWGGYIRSTGECFVHIEGSKDAPWDRLKGPGFVMDEGYLDIQAARFIGQDSTVFALSAAPMKTITVFMYDVEANVGGALSRVWECSGNVNGVLYDCQMRQQNPMGGTGVMFIGSCGNIQLIDGLYEDVGGSFAVDHRAGHLWLTGGVDLACVRGGGYALYVDNGAMVSRGHCNFRTGRVLIQAGATENTMRSSFAELWVGPSMNMISLTPWIGGGLPAGGKYPPGTILVWMNDPLGFPNLYMNQGTLAAPVWRHPQYYSPGNPGNWAGAQPATLSAAMDRVVAAVVARTIGGAIP